MINRIYKIVLMPLLFSLLLSCFVSCSVPFENDPETVYVIFRNPDTETYNENNKYQLSKEDSRLVCNIFNNAIIQENNLWKCEFDTIIIMGGQKWHYSSSQGTFNNYDEIQCFEILEEERINLNLILDSYRTGKR